jgi:ankyrin repeat protein|tara:strand:+ start:130 stop:492 length:363 start_codon:yes stop_codon:yes gene_type:complete
MVTAISCRVCRLKTRGHNFINAKDKNGNTALMYAASNDKIDIAKILLDAGADVNAINKRRSTALIIAAWHGYINMVEVLINAGADVSVKNKDGNTALKIATEINDQKKITSLLVEAGAVK